MAEKTEQKPLIVEIDEAKQEIVGVINSTIKRGIPCYIIDMFLSDIYAQIKAGAQTELEMAKNKMKDEEKGQ